MSTGTNHWPLCKLLQAQVSGQQYVGCMSGVKGAQGVLSGSGQPMAVPSAKIIISMHVCSSMPARLMLDNESPEVLQCR